MGSIDSLILFHRHVYLLVLSDQDCLEILLTLAVLIHVQTINLEIIQLKDVCQFAQVLQVIGQTLNLETVYTIALQTVSHLTEPIDSVSQIAESILPMVISYLKFVSKDALKIIGQITHHIFVFLNALTIQICMQIT